MHTNLFVGKIFFCRGTLQPTVARKRGRWVYERGEVEQAEKEELKVTACYSVWKLIGSGIIGVC